MKPHPDFAWLEVPTTATLGPYHLTILTPADVEEDFEAVSGSEAVLRGIFGPTWPAGLTLEDNLTDLHWHYREFTEKRSFAWIIRDRDGAYLGCAYLNPDIGARGKGEAAFWFTDSPDRQAHLAAFGPLYEAWVKGMLPGEYRLNTNSNAHL
ncbi:MAG: hypothetical protein P1U53_12845 [Sulfitobacter sp.]|nr:hypothetical protein [Sulfitobacter sp.]